MKPKMLSVKSGNRNPTLDTLEADVNTWLEGHPGVVIEHTSDQSQPNMSWSHPALAVWYTEK